MIVMKFGGTSVEDAQAISRLVNLVRGRLRQQPVIVSSAMAGVTDKLLQAAATATSGNQSATLDYEHGNTEQLIAEYPSQAEMIRGYKKI